MDASDIADPRVYADAASASRADAELYDIARRALAADTAREVDALTARLRDALAARLRADGASLAALFAAAPSVDVARTLWRALDAAWRDAVGGGAVAVTLFALPIVVVVAGTGAVGGTLPGTIGGADALAALLRGHHALRGNETLALASTLVSPDALDVARLPQLIAWQRIDRPGVLRDLAPAPMPYVANRERVHARLLVGSALAAAGVALLDAEPRRGWAMPFARELVRRLAVPAATVLALAKPPAYPLHAVREARASQREVAAQLFASNALRAIRARSGEPVAIVSAHRAADALGGGELRVSLASPFEPRDAEGFRCPLYPIDRAGDVARMLVGLLRDCAVTDVRVLEGVHADRVPGTTRLLLFRPDSMPSGASPLH
jgi:hypothetical protein